MTDFISFIDFGRRTEFHDKDFSAFLDHLCACAGVTPPRF